MIENVNINKRSAERGNVLFLILIAVALFAALSYAVTSSTRSGGGDVSSETNLVSSAALTQYPASVKTSILRMIISQGVGANELEFDPPSTFDAGSATYGVFHPSAGGATYETAPADVMASGSQGTWLFNSAYAIDNIGTDTADNTRSDIIAFLPGIKESICERINLELGISASGDDTNSNGVPDAGIAIANVPVAGDNQDAGNTGIETYDANNFIDGPDVVGQPYGCVDFDDANSTDAGDLVYYHVLIER